MSLDRPSAEAVQYQRPVRRDEAFIRHGLVCRLSLESANLLRLEIAFATQELRRLCEVEAAAQAAFGVLVASRLKARLADLDDATVLSDIAVGRPRPVGSDAGLDVLLDLTRDASLLLRVNHAKVPSRQDRAVDWSRVSRVKIMRIDAAND